MNCLPTVQAYIDERVKFLKNSLMSGFLTDTEVVRDHQERLDEMRNIKHFVDTLQTNVSFLEVEIEKITNPNKPN